MSVPPLPALWRDDRRRRSGPLQPVCPVPAAGTAAAMTDYYPAQFPGSPAGQFLTGLRRALADGTFGQPLVRAARVDERPECEHCGERTNTWNLSWRDWCSDCESESEDES